MDDTCLFYDFMKYVCLEQVHVVIKQSRYLEGGTFVGATKNHIIPH